MLKDKDLLQSRGYSQQQLFQRAISARENSLGNMCEVRSVCEISNCCRQSCSYCGMASQSKVERFRLKKDQIIEQLSKLDRRASVLIQGGEDVEIIDQVCNIISEFPEYNFTISLGSLPAEQYKKLYESGASRYILKFETSNSKLHEKLRTTDTLAHRLKKIEELMSVGFEVSTGNIVGLPGQTEEMILDDLKLMDSLGCRLLSTSPFIPNSSSLLAKDAHCDLDLVLNFIAMLRISFPDSLIPSVSALEILSPGGHARGFDAGANVLTLHDTSKTHYNSLFQIYDQSRYEPDQKSLSILQSKSLTPSFVPLI